MLSEGPPAPPSSYDKTARQGPLRPRVGPSWASLDVGIPGPLDNAPLARHQLVNRLMLAAVQAQQLFSLASGSGPWGPNQLLTRLAINASRKRGWLVYIVGGPS